MNAILPILSTAALAAPLPTPPLATDVWRRVDPPAVQAMDGHEKEGVTWLDERRLKFEDGTVTQRDRIAKRGAQGFEDVLDIRSTGHLEGLPEVWASGAEHAVAIVLRQEVKLHDYPHVIHFEGKLESEALALEGFESSQGFHKPVAHVDPACTEDRLTCTLRLPTEYRGDELTLVWKAPSFGTVTYTYRREPGAARGVDADAAPTPEPAPERTSDPDGRTLPTDGGSPPGGEPIERRYMEELGSPPPPAPSLERLASFTCRDDYFPADSDVPEYARPPAWLAFGLPSTNDARTWALPSDLMLTLPAGWLRVEPPLPGPDYQWVRPYATEAWSVVDVTVVPRERIPYGMPLAQAEEVLLRDFLTLHFGPLDRALVAPELESRPGSRKMTAVFEEGPFSPEELAEFAEQEVEIGEIDPQAFTRSHCTAWLTDDSIGLVVVRIPVPFAHERRGEADIQATFLPSSEDQAGRRPDTMAPRASYGRELEFELPNEYFLPRITENDVFGEANARTDAVFRRLTGGGDVTFVLFSFPIEEVVKGLGEASPAMFRRVLLDEAKSPGNSVIEKPAIVGDLQIVRGALTIDGVPTGLAFVSSASRVFLVQITGPAGSALGVRRDLDGFCSTLRFRQPTANPSLDR